MGHDHIKTLANPRSISKYSHPHYPVYFNGLYSVNEIGRVVEKWSYRPVTAEKIVLNHYFSKSKEEFLNKLARGRMYVTRSIKAFDNFDRNDEFDDSILAYRDARAKVYQPPKPRSNDDLIKALEKNLPSDAPPDFYTGKMETFLTCRAVASYLKEKLSDNAQAKLFEEASLKAIIKSLDKMSLADAQFLIRELPKLLSLPYPATKDLLVEIIQRIPHITKKFRQNGLNEWFIKLYNVQDFLSEILNLKRDVTARIDIKLISAEGDFQIVSLSDSEADLWKPGWFQKGGIGYQIQSCAGKLEIIAKSTVEGQIKLNLLGLDVRAFEHTLNSSLPYWVNYTKLVVNGNTIFNKRTPAWHNKRYDHTVDAKAGEEIKIQVEWLSNNSNV